MIARQAVKAVFFVCALTGVCCMQPVVAESAEQIQRPTEIEVVHWWHRGGDAAALSLIVNEFTRRGGSWFDVAEATYADTRAKVVSRMAKGYPPTAVQWNAGLEIKQFAQLGLLNAVSSTTHVLEFERNYHPAVLREVTVDGKIFGIPVNLHRENWMWTNTKKFMQINRSAPETLPELIEVAAELQGAGITPIAVGRDDWQKRILFNDVLLGVIGSEAYEKFYVTLDESVVDTEEFRQAVETYIALKQYSSSFGSGSWDEQVAAIAAGEAAMLFMGDWAKGEFDNLQARLGDDFDCKPAPGNSDRIMPVIDVFLLGRVSEPLDLDGQRLLIDTLQHTDTIIEFNKLKGSVPPFLRYDKSQLDKCSRQVTALLATQGSVTPAFARLGDGEFANQLQSAIMKLWQPEFNSVAESLESFRQVIRLEDRRRSTMQSIPLTAETDQ